MYRKFQTHAHTSHPTIFGQFSENLLPFSYRIWITYMQNLTDDNTTCRYKALKLHSTINSRYVHNSQNNKQHMNSIWTNQIVNLTAMCLETRVFFNLKAHIYTHNNEPSEPTTLLSLPRRNAYKHKRPFIYDFHSKFCALVKCEFVCVAYISNSA